MAIAVGKTLDILLVVSSESGQCRRSLHTMRDLNYQQTYAAMFRVNISLVKETYPIFEYPVPLSHMMGARRAIIVVNSLSTTTISN